MEVVLAAAVPADGGETPRYGVVEGDEAAMTSRGFIKRIDARRVEAAIKAAEQRTSAEIRIFISRQEAEDAPSEAARQFEKLGMHRTAGRNGVLIFVAPRSRTFAIVGDQAIHARGGDALWDGIASQTAAFFAGGDFTGGMIRAVEMAGESLARHFPIQAGDRNELPNQIVEG